MTLQSPPHLPLLTLKSNDHSWQAGQLVGISGDQRGFCVECLCQLKQHVGEIEHARAGGVGGGGVRRGG